MQLICTHTIPPHVYHIHLNFTKTINKLEKALGERRYLRQGKAICQVASPSSLCQRSRMPPLTQW